MKMKMKMKMKIGWWVDIFSEIFPLIPITGVAGDDDSLEELKDAFELYDQDKNGLISAANLHHILHRLISTQNPSTSLSMATLAEATCSYVIRWSLKKPHPLTQSSGSDGWKPVLSLILFLSKPISLPSLTKPEKFRVKICESKSLFVY
ncbi:putative calcium-binding protein CML27 [Camellia lanceoleosa]|uniref:Calcium-binding protein CML27 n=1 Tax=Camellia lanceoleosa TaxID=1840588 RepID=A0ACC0GAR6_9ERIC|nr:putative calcium-binding protein CML27 [Camellia lanceoleosa]